MELCLIVISMEDILPRSQYHRRRMDFPSGFGQLRGVGPAFCSDLTAAATVCQPEKEAMVVIQQEDGSLKRLCDLFRKSPWKGEVS